jgi:hypothetical protein
MGQMGYLAVITALASLASIGVFGNTDLAFAVSDTPIQIDIAALLLAGLQTSAVWIMSALAIIGSLAFGAVYITVKKN